MAKSTWLKTTVVFSLALSCLALMSASTDASIFQDSAASTLSFFNIGMSNSEHQPKTPVRIVIPTLNLDAKISAMGTDSSGAFDVPRGPYGVSWYNKSAFPGYPGNAILAGHNYWNDTPGTFVNLHQLDTGDIAVIYYHDQTKKLFEVISKSVFLIEDEPDSVMALTGETRTTLITCAGSRLSTGGFDSCLAVILQAVTIP